MSEKFGHHKLRFLVKDNGTVLQELVEVVCRDDEGNDSYKEEWRDVPFIPEKEQYNPDSTYFEEKYE